MDMIAEGCIDLRACALDPGTSFETEHCCVFGWYSKRFLETGDPMEMLFGNPISCVTF
jgi:hypothetical protein